MITVGNAAGWLKRPADFTTGLLRIPTEFLHAITLGSYTLAPRPGNSGTTFWSDGEDHPTSLNALGLPNPGIEEVAEFLFPLARDIHNSGKIVRVSIAGFSPEEYEEAVGKLLGIRYVNSFELNFGCPNVRVDGAQERIMSFDPDELERTLRLVDSHTDHVGAPGIDVKLSPYSDPYLRTEVGRVLRKNSRKFQHLVTCNTFGNAFGFRPEGSPLIGANDGYAGLAGKPLKYIALGEVRQFVHMLQGENPVIGVGGVSWGQDLLDFERAGAVAAQIGTEYFASNDPRVFYRTGVDYAELRETVPV